MLGVTIAVEGPTDAPVLVRLLRDRGIGVGPTYIIGGCANLDRKLDGYNNAAKFSPWIVLRDLDDGECAPSVVDSLMPRPSKLMRFQIAVRSLESWLIGDFSTLSKIMAVSESVVPKDPESLRKPKQVLIDLARRSRKRSIRDAMVPNPGSTARVGPGYLAFVEEYTATLWRPEVAANRCPSLARLAIWLDELPTIVANK